MQFAVIGAGVIGAGWAARFLLMGFDVKIFDPNPNAQRIIEQTLINARRSMPGLYDYMLPTEGKYCFCESIAETVTNVDWISESSPERLDIKHIIFNEIQQYCSHKAIIASSTSGFKPSELQNLSSNPDQIIVAHPFNPVYLMPLVELVGAIDTANRASSVISNLGMYPLVIRKEIDAHIADRLLEAVWREGLWLINDDIATTTEIDNAIRYGFGLRWAQMGMFETYRIAGGEAGMKHFIEQFGPALKWPWTKLMDVPELSQALISKISDQSDDQSGHHSITDLEHIRDDNLVGMMRALKLNDWGVGNLLNAVDNQLKTTNSNLTTLLTHRNNIQTIHRVVPTTWLDLNGHMNDSHYAEVFSQASEVVLNRLGADQEYVDRGFSYFTVDMKIDFLKECNAGDVINVVTDIIIAEGKKLDLKHEMRDLNGNLIARCSQFLLHVDLELRKSCLPAEPLKSLLLNLEATISN